MNSAKTQSEEEKEEEAQCEAIEPGEPLELQAKGGRGRERVGKARRNE